MKRKLTLTSILSVFIFICNAQLQINDFILGAYWTPFLYTDVTLCPADFDGDGLTDLATRTNSGPKQGQLRIDYASGGFSAFDWDFNSALNKYGTIDDKPIPADYTGDGKADMAVYNPKTKKLSIWQRNSINTDFANNPVVIQYTSADLSDDAIPLPGDFNGDGNLDVSFKMKNGKWLIDYSNQGGVGDINFTGTIYGDENSIPVPGDYNGDGQTDLAIKNDAGDWKVDVKPYGSWNGGLSGLGNNITAYPAPADYDGDGKTDISYVNKLPGDVNDLWTVLQSSNNNSPLYYYKHGTNSGAVAIPGKYHTSVKADLSICFNNPAAVGSDGKWFIDSLPSGWDYISEEGKAGHDFITTELNPIDIDALNKIKDCNFNLVIGQMTYQSQKQNDYYLTLLNSVSAANPNPGLNAFLSNGNIATFKDPSNSTTENNNFVSHYKGLSTNLNKWIYGIDLGDEPYPDDYTDASGKYHEKEMTNMEAWADFFYDLTNGWRAKSTFTNLLPRYGFQTDIRYEAYLDDYKNRDDRSPFISYDFYPFRASGFYKSYFYNMSIVKSKFPERKLINVVHTCSETGIPDETDAQRYFMAFCPVAYGAKGINYFLYDNRGNTNFGNAPNAPNEENKYNSIKTINLYIKNIVAPVVMNKTNTGTLHKANTSLNTGYLFEKYNELLTGAGLIYDVSNNNSDNILFGIFQNANEDPYIWIVNKSVDDITGSLTLSINGNYTAKISPSVNGYNGSTTYTLLSRTLSGNITNFAIPSLGKGEGRMIQLFSFIAPAPEIKKSTLLASKTEDKILNLYDLSGRLLHEINGKYSIGELQTKYNLQNGVYMITVLKDGKIVSEKISVFK